MAKSEQEINAEKDAKPRCDLESPYLTLSVGRGMGFGARKHGTPGGLGTYRVPNTEQARLRTHIASLKRHIAELEMGLLYVPDCPQMLVMDAITSQVNICADIYFDPPQPPDEYDMRYPWPDGSGGVRVVHVIKAEGPSEPPAALSSTMEHACPRLPPLPCRSDCLYRANCERDVAAMAVDSTPDDDPADYFLEGTPP